MTMLTPMMACERKEGRRGATFGRGTAFPLTGLVDPQENLKSFMDYVCSILILLGAN